MQADEDGRQVKEVVRIAVGKVAPEELSRFDEVWQAYLDDPRDSRKILKSREVALGAGVDLLATAMTPLLAAITGEALAALVKEQAADFISKVTGRLGGSARRREARRAALAGPAPHPGELEHMVMRALILDIARKSGCTEGSAAAVTDALVSAFTQETGPAGAGAPPGAKVRPAEVTPTRAVAGKPWRRKPRQPR